MYMLKTDEWYLERLTWLIGGAFTFISAALAYLHSEYWLIFTAFIGFNLMVYALTGFCLMANILYKLGAKPRLGRD
ncbi:MAG: DUF2892 domain-containing protein [Nitrospirae bacterium]|nr:DUF2892 domain-containing protein [Nitrospirota bacterium]